MNKTGAIIATILTSLLCGIPGLILGCIGVLAAFGTQMPDVMAQAGTNLQNVGFGIAMFIGAGAILVLIPILVGIFSLRKKRTAPVPAVNIPQPMYVPPQAPPPPAAVPQSVTPPFVQAAPQPGERSTNDPGQDLYNRLMGLNRPTAPYRIVDGRAENVTLIAEWKIVDAQWYEVFAKANLTKVFRIYLKFDPEHKEVLGQDREYSVSWEAGVPRLGGEASFFKGQKSSISFGIGTGFTETLSPGVVYKYKFNTNELKQPIQDVIASCGWTYKGVAFGKI